jgi:asparagine synthase (glutamine-hydrolysing)
MSGGGDLVAYTSAPARGRDTVMVRGRIADESDIAGQTARFLGIEHEIIRTEQPLLDSLRGHARYYQEPVRNVLNVGWWSEIDRRAAERGATVLLTGEVGNLTFSAGGLSALSDWVRKRQLRRWWSEALSASRRRDVRWRGILMSSFRFLLPKRVTEELIRLFLAQPRWSTACFVRSELLSRLPDLRPAQPDRQAEERLRVMRGYDAGVVRTGTLAKYGIDERDPTADRRLVEFSLRLPPEHLLDRGTYKPLARAVLADRVPALVLDAPLRGYQGADWISRISKADALSTLEEISSNSTVHEVIDIERLRRTISNWPIAAANQPDGSIESFGRHVTNALSMGVFVIESEDHGTLGV